MITNFHEEYYFLSNFYPIEIYLDGLVFDSVEHAYQASKSMLLSERLFIQTCSTPGKAKRLGRKLSIRKDWETVKVDIMKNLLIDKFSVPYLKELLLKTSPQILIEGNNWGDTFWGCINQNNTWIGNNVLGKLLMEIRDTIS